MNTQVPKILSVLSRLVERFNGYRGILICELPFINGDVMKRYITHTLAFPLVDTAEYEAGWISRYGDVAKDIKKLVLLGEIIIVGNAMKNYPSIVYSTDPEWVKPFRRLGFVTVALLPATETEMRLLWRKYARGKVSLPKLRILYGKEEWQEFNFISNSHIRVMERIGASVPIFLQDRLVLMPRIARYQFSSRDFGWAVRKVASREGMISLGTHGEEAKVLSRTNHVCLSLDASFGKTVFPPQVIDVQGDPSIFGSLAGRDASGYSFEFNGRLLEAGRGPLLNETSSYTFTDMFECYTYGGAEPDLTSVPMTDLPWTYRPTKDAIHNGTRKLFLVAVRYLTHIGIRPGHVVAAIGSTPGWYYRMLQYMFGVRFILVDPLPYEGLELDCSVEYRCYVQDLTRTAPKVMRPKGRLFSDWPIPKLHEVYCVLWDVRRDDFRDNEIEEINADNRLAVTFCNDMKWPRACFKFRYPDTSVKMYKDDGIQDGIKGELVVQPYARLYSSEGRIYATWPYSTTHDTTQSWIKMFIYYNSVVRNDVAYEGAIMKEYVDRRPSYVPVVALFSLSNVENHGEIPPGTVVYNKPSVAARSIWPPGLHSTWVWYYVTSIKTASGDYSFDHGSPVKDIRKEFSLTVEPWDIIRGWEWDGSAWRYVGGQTRFKGVKMRRLSHNIQGKEYQISGEFIVTQLKHDVAIDHLVNPADECFKHNVRACGLTEYVEWRKITGAKMDLDELIIPDDPMVRCWHIYTNCEDYVPYQTTAHSGTWSFKSVLSSIRPELNISMARFNSYRLDAIRMLLEPLGYKILATVPGVFNAYVMRGSRKRLISVSGHMIEGLAGCMLGITSYPAYLDTVIADVNQWAAGNTNVMNNLMEKGMVAEEGVVSSCTHPPLWHSYYEYFGAVITIILYAKVFGFPIPIRAILRTMVVINRLKRVYRDFVHADSAKAIDWEAAGKDVRMAHVGDFN
jgi:hypothetical protein